MATKKLEYILKTFSGLVENAGHIAETLCTLYVNPVDQWNKAFPLSWPVLLKNWRVSCQNPVDQWNLLYGHKKIGVYS